MNKGFKEWLYTPVEGHWDEAALPSGLPRRHWRRLAVAMARMGFRQFSRCWHTGHQLIQANGITYNVSSDPQGEERPWPMDPIPLPIAAEDWAQIERAVIQRATLLNLILRDLYQERRLIRERHLPSALLFDNPHFLRPCFGITPPHGVHLHTYAVDIGRARRMAAGGSFRIAPRRPPASATRSRTAWSARAFCRPCSASATCVR